MLFRYFNNSLTFLVGVFFISIINAAPLLWNIPSRNLHFVGRSEQLQGIETLLQEGRMAVLSGYSGLGKSQIAKEFAHKHADQYHIVWWFHGNQYLEPQFHTFAELLNRRLKLGLEDKIESMNPERLVKTIFYELERRDLQCLFVFDDVETLEKLKTYIPFRRKNHLIFTTQNANFSINQLSILPFSRPESLELLLGVFPDASRDELDSLAEHLKDNPSSLALASEYIRQYPGMKITDYVKKYKSTVLRVGQRQRHGDPTDSYEKDVRTATLLNLEALKNTSMKSNALLNFLALSHLSGAQIDHIHAWMDLKEIPQQEVVKLLNHMKDYSLVNIEGDKVGMHELIQRIITEVMSDGEKMELIDEIVLLLTKEFSGRSDLVSEKMMKDPAPLLHAERILKIADEMGYQMVEISILRVAVFDVMTCGIRDIQKATQVAEQLERDFVSGIILPQKEEILYNITHSVYSAMNTSNYDEAIFYGNKAFTLLEDREDMVEEKLRLTANFIQYYSLGGDLDKCPALIKDGDKLLPYSQSMAYNALFIFATTLYEIDKGEISEAIALIKAHQNLLEKLTLYPSIKFYILNQLAEAQLKDGQINEALQTISESEKCALDFYPDNENTFFGNLNTLKALALLQKSNESKEAESHIIKALETYDKLVKEGDYHRGQAFANLVYGKLLLAQQKYEGAKKMLLRSEDIYNHALKSKSVDDVSELYTSLAILGMELSEDELTQTYLKKHMSLFGADHPRTKLIMITLDQRGLNL